MSTRRRRGLFFFSYLGVLSFALRRTGAFWQAGGTRLNDTMAVLRVCYVYFCIFKTKLRFLRCNDEAAPDFIFRRGIELS